MVRWEKDILEDIYASSSTISSTLNLGTIRTLEQGGTLDLLKGGTIDYLKATKGIIVLHSSSSETISGTSGLSDITNYRECVLCLDVTGVVADSTLDFALQGKDETSGKFRSIFSTILTTTSTEWSNQTSLPYQNLRGSWTIGGTTPAFTFSAALQCMN